MASLISNFTSKVYSQLPQNEHTANASKIKAQVQGLTDALSDKTSTIFTSKLTETKEKLTSEKKSCLSALIRLNGEFFQDPKSALKKAWDSVVSAVETALNLKVEHREELDAVSVELKSKPADQTIEQAQSAIYVYTALEKKRNNTEIRLNEIISTEKTDPVAPPSEDALRQRQQELCGDYYQDPNCLLDKKWKAYQKALTEGSANTQDILNEYNLLENERKSNEILLQRLGRVAPASFAHSIETLTAQSISDEIVTLKQEKAKEEALSGIDWKKTAVTATAVTGAAIGATYLL